MSVCLSQEEVETAIMFTYIGWERRTPQCPPPNADITENFMSVWELIENVH